MNIQKIRALSFDLDDTLWPIGPTLAKAEDALVAWFSQHTPKALLIYQDKVLVNEIRQALKDQFKDRMHDLSAIRKELIREVLIRADEPTSGVDHAFDAFFQARQSVELYPDVLPALDKLSKRFELLALSNGNADIEQVGLGRYFSHAISAQDFGASKPDPRIFQHAADCLKLPTHELLHIGDDAYTDIQGAQGLQMPCVWVNRLGAAWAGEGVCPLTVKDLSELVRLLQV
jgi:FMN hydrolase / 5-amino-6-(5-phospho-D-ribitylamino)uracil phosphatase